jgi:hypothetical protein
MSTRSTQDTAAETTRLLRDLPITIVVAILLAVLKRLGYLPSEENGERLSKAA